MRISSFLKIATLSSAVFLLGAGCIRIKAVVSDGGVFLSKNGGSAWEQHVFVRQDEKKTVTIGGEDITTMVSDPKNPAVLYVGTEQSGIYKTENGGEVWQSFLPTKGRISGIAVNPKDPKNIFIAVGEQVLKTNDGGSKWEIAYPETRPKVTLSDLVIDGFDPKKIYIGLSNGDLMQSVDGGASWSVLHHVGSKIMKILIHPKDTRVITILTETDGIHRTTNLGKDWQSPIKELGAYRDLQRGQIIAADPKSKDHLIYISNFAFLETKNGGKDWKEIKSLITPSTTPVTAFTLASQNADHFYLATATTLYRSRDHGKTWTISLLPTTKRPSMILVDTKDEKLVYLGVNKQKK